MDILLYLISVTVIFEKFVGKHGKRKIMIIFMLIDLKRNVRVNFVSVLRTETRSLIEDGKQNRSKNKNRMIYSTKNKESLQEFKN